MLVPAGVLEANRGLCWKSLGTIRALQAREDEARAAYRAALEAQPNIIAQQLRDIERDPSRPSRKQDIDDVLSFVTLALGEDDRRAALARLETIRNSITPEAIVNG